MDALGVASASPFCFKSWCDERIFPSVLSTDSRGDRVAGDGEPGTGFCNWLSCVCTWVACFCSSAAAATASLCFFNSNWWCRSWARISRSNRRASRASRSFYCMQKIVRTHTITQKVMHYKLFNMISFWMKVADYYVPSNVEPRVRRAWALVRCAVVHVASLRQFVPNSCLLKNSIE